MTSTTTSGTSEEVSNLKHDLANAECAARLMSEAYDRMVLKYEARIAELENEGASESKSFAPGLLRKLREN